MRTMEHFFDTISETTVRAGRHYSILLTLILFSGCVDKSGSDEATSDVRYVDPQTKEYLDRAEYAIGRRAYHAALVLLDSAAMRTPALPDISFMRGRVYLESDRYDDAYASFKEMLSFAPDYEGAWYYFGNSAFRKMKYREALNAYQWAREIDGTSAGLAYNIGRAYAQLGVADSALYAYSEALALDSTHADAHVWLAKLYETEGNFNQALEHWQQALALRPADTEPRFGVGSLLFRVGRSDEALSHLEKVLEQGPKHEGALFTAAQALMHRGQEREAQAYLVRLESVKQEKERIQKLQRDAKLNPGDPEGWLTLAKALRDAGFIDAAIDAHEVAVSLVPDNLALQNNLANLYLAKSDTMEALRQYYAILQQDSTVADVWLNVGVIYANSGHAIAAQNAWETALRLDSSHAEAQRYLSKLMSIDSWHD